MKIGRILIVILFMNVCGLLNADPIHDAAIAGNIARVQAVLESDS